VCGKLFLSGIFFQNAMEQQHPDGCWSLSEYEGGGDCRDSVPI